MRRPVSPAKKPSTWTGRPSLRKARAALTPLPPASLIGDTFFCRSSGVEPTMGGHLAGGDRVAVARSIYAFQEPERFDIVFAPRSTIGNIDLFSRQFFGETSAILGSTLIGWELFNLDKVFTYGKYARTP